MKPRTQELQDCKENCKEEGYYLEEERLLDRKAHRKRRTRGQIPACLFPHSFRLPKVPVSPVPRLTCSFVFVVV